MKRFFLFLLCIMLAGVPQLTLSETEVENEIAAPSFIMVDAADPTTALYSKKSDLKVAPCSTLKILTCMLAIENGSLLETVTVSKKAASLPETHSRMGLKAGEKISVTDLLYGLMLCSGNDAAIALAEHVSGTQEDFVVLMNQRALELGMVNSHFVNCHGVHSEEQYTTAGDMAILACYAIKNETFRKVTGTTSYTAAANEVRKKPIEMVSSNWLMGTGASRFAYEYAIGGKTGSSASQGKSLVSMAERDGVTLVCCMFALKEGGDRGDRLQIIFADSKYLFEQTFEKKYTAVSAADLKAEFSSVVGGVQNAAEAAAELKLKSVFSDERILLNNDDLAAIEAGQIELELVPTVDEKLAAPIAEGQQLGEIDCMLNGRRLFKGKLVSENGVDEFVPTPEPTPAPTPAPTEIPTTEPTQDPSELAEGGGEGVDSSLVFGLLIGGLVLIAACTAAIILLGLSRKRNKEKQ